MSEIFRGCTEGRLSVYSAVLGTLIDTVFAHTDMILAVEFSPNDRYLVTTGLDKAVRVVTWPTLSPYLAVGFYQPTQVYSLDYTWHTKHFHQYSCDCIEN